MPVNIGFIGTGMIALQHGQALQMLDRPLRIRAAYDIDAANARTFAEQTGAQCCSSVQQLLAMDLDAVYICTRHDSHHALVRAAAQADKAIFCEKPLALQPDQAEDMVDLVTRRDIPFTVGFNHRFSPGVMELKRRVQGKLPRSMHVSLVSPPFLHGWAGLPDVGGGILHCLGSHVFDLTCHLMGTAPDDLAAFTERQRVADDHLDDTAVAIMRFPGGRLASMQFHDNGTTPYSVDPEAALVRLEVFLDGQVAGGYPLRSMHFDQGEGMDYFSVPDPRRVVSWGYEGINRHFVQYLTGELKHPPVSIQEALTIVKLVHAAHTSQITGSVVRISDDQRDTLYHGTPCCDTPYRNTAFRAAGKAAE